MLATRQDHCSCEIQFTLGIHEHRKSPMKGRGTQIEILVEGRHFQDQNPSTMSAQFPKQKNQSSLTPKKFHDTRSCWGRKVTKRKKVRRTLGKRNDRQGKSYFLSKSKPRKRFPMFDVVLFAKKLGG